MHGEKGMIAMRYLSKNTAIKDIQGGTARNIVCRNCYVVIDKNSFSRKTLEDYFNNENLEFSIENLNENDVKILYRESLRTLVYQNLVRMHYPT